MPSQDLSFFYWEEGRERDQFVVPLMHAFIGCFLSVPWPEIKLATLVYQDNALTNWAAWPGSLGSFFFFYYYFLLIDFREGKERRGEREGGRKRETSICFSTYLCFHWLLLLLWALTRDQSRNLTLAYWDNALTNWATPVREPGLFSTHIVLNKTHMCLLHIWISDQVACWYNSDAPCWKRDLLTTSSSISIYF